MPRQNETATDAAGLNPVPSKAPSDGFLALQDFLTRRMSMSHIYQPLMIRTMLAGGGAATRRQIAAAFLAADLSQLEYYEEITKGYPQQTLRRHELIEHERGVYRLTAQASPANEWERAALIAACDAKVADYVARRQDAIWRHRAQNFEPIPGTIRYQVIARAMGRCEACGVSNAIRALQVDHIIPRSAGGTNDLWNFQALCSLCNVQKLNKDATDFHAAHQAYEHRLDGCALCEQRSGAVVLENELVYAVRTDSRELEDQLLIVPRRHVSDYLSLTQPEVNALRQVELSLTKMLRLEDPSIQRFRFESFMTTGASSADHFLTQFSPVRTGDE